MNEKNNCKKCNREVDALDTFSGGICLACYKIRFEKLSEQERYPDFTNVVK